MSVFNDAWRYLGLCFMLLSVEVYVEKKKIWENWKTKRKGSRVEIEILTRTKISIQSRRGRKKMFC